MGGQIAFWGEMMAIQQKDENVYHLILLQEAAMKPDAFNSLLTPRKSFSPACSLCGLHTVPKINPSGVFYFLFCLSFIFTPD